MIDCTRHGSLERIPNITNRKSKRHYLKHITQLDLTRTNIDVVPTDAFHGLIGLKTIVINECKNLRRIKMFAFRNLPNLKTLIITNNPNLVTLEPHAMGSLRNLNYLSLSMNNLKTIDGYVFSSSTSIKRISFIGNPIRTIKSHAFHGLKNVTDLLISLNQNVAPIKKIEGDAFISLAFVDQIFLDGIPSQSLATNTFRGLSYCKTIHLSNTYIEHIGANAFFRANHIENLNLINSRIRSLHKDAFSSMFKIGTIDLSGNYITKLDKGTFEQLIHLEDVNSLDGPNLINKSSILLINERNRNQEKSVKKILLEQNPIQCDCQMMWLLKNKAYTNYISLPEICAGPRGFDCLRVSDLTVEKLSCAEFNKNPARGPCQDLEFSYNQSQSQIVNEIFSIQKEDGNKQFIDKYEEDDAEYDYQDYQDYYTVVTETMTISDMQTDSDSVTSIQNPNRKQTKAPNVPIDRMTDNLAGSSHHKNSNDQAKSQDKIITPISSNSAHTDRMFSDSMRIIMFVSCLFNVLANSFD